MHYSTILRAEALSCFIYAPKKATHYHHADVVRSVTAVDPKTGALSDAGCFLSRMRKTAPEKIAG